MILLALTFLFLGPVLSATIFFSITFHVVCLVYSKSTLPSHKMSIMLLLSLNRSGVGMSTR